MTLSEMENAIEEARSDLRELIQAISVSEKRAEEAERKWADARESYKLASARVYAIAAERDSSQASLLRVEAALKRLAIVAVHRPAYGIGTVHVGWRCKLCEVDNLDPEKIAHPSSCALARTALSPHTEKTA